MRKPRHLQIRHSVYFRITEGDGEVRAGEYFIDLPALNFIDAAHQVRMNFENIIDKVVIETITIRQFSLAPKVLYDRDTVHF